MLKCAPGDMPGPGSLPQRHAISDRHKGVIQVFFRILLHDNQNDVEKKFGDEKKIPRKDIEEYIGGGS